MLQGSHTRSSCLHPDPEHSQKRGEAGSGRKTNPSSKGGFQEEPLSMWVRNEAHAGKANRGAQQLVPTISNSLHDLITLWQLYQAAL